MGEATDARGENYAQQAFEATETARAMRFDRRNRRGKQWLRAGGVAADRIALQGVVSRSTRAREQIRGPAALQPGLHLQDDAAGRTCRGHERLERDPRQHEKTRGCEKASEACCGRPNR